MLKFIKHDYSKDGQRSLRLLVPLPIFIKGKHYVFALDEIRDGWQVLKFGVAVSWDRNRCGLHLSWGFCSLAKQPETQVFEAPYATR